jgi:hypothetical protein
MKSSEEISKDLARLIRIRGISARKASMKAGLHRGAEKMSVDRKTVLAWQKLLRTRYPQVVVEESVDTPNDGMPFFDVFLIPDRENKNFIRFAIDELPALREGARLPEAHLIPHSASATRKYYPEIF